MEFRLLGVLEVVNAEGRVVDVGRPKQRALLALLVLQANRVISVPAIVDGLWGDDPPPSAANVVQGYVSRLRKVLAPGVGVVTVAPGYRLELPAAAIDVTVFERLVGEGRSALARGEPIAAAAALGKALALRRGPALAEFVELPFAAGHAARLDGLARAAEDEFVEACLAQGQASELLPEVERLVEEEPFSERRWGQLMTALYRAGRQADALDAFQRARRVFVEQLGLEPGPELRRIEADVLAQSLAAPVPLPRGAVTFLLTDIEGSTRLWERDREAMAAAMVRHDEITSEVVRQHRGQLRKTRGEGDSTFSVFAGPTDAVGAALELQLAFGSEAWPTGMLVAVRAVVHTGEAELRDGDYYGPAVNRAARVRSVAQGSQVLVTAATAALVSDTLPLGAGLRDLGRHRLKDLDRPEQLFQLTHPALVDGFGPLATVGASTNLPSRSSRLVGRDDALAEVAGALDGSRLVTLTGAGGCGKTSLAVAAAGAVADRFPDGVWFVDLAAVSSGDQVADAVAGVLGVRERSGQTLVRSVAEYLGPQRTLLLLDNCEHVRSESGAVIDAVLRAGPAAQILATSRERLGLTGELTWVVPPLDQHTAMGLFGERARAALPAFDPAANPGAVAQLCDRLDGMPLAIELAAARVNVLSVEQISARLDDAVRLLGDDTAATVPRQRTLRATLEWSYELLTDPERRLFERLGVFAGSFTLEAVEALGGGDGVPGEDVVGFFVRLVDKSLVARDDHPGDHSEPRYRLLETLRQYARTRLAAAGDDADATAAHAAHYVDLAETIEPRLRAAGSRRWLDRIADDDANFRAALDWAFTPEVGDHETGVRLVGALQWAWFIDGRIAEGRAWADRAVEVTGGDRTFLRGRALEAAGLLATAHSDLERAAACAGELLALGEELDSVYLRAAGSDLLGIARWAQGRFDEAIALHAQSAELYRSYVNRWDEAASSAELGRALADAGRLDEARAALELSVRRARSLGEDAALGFTLDASAVFALRVGELERAAELIGEAVDHYRASGYLEGLASGLNTRALIALGSANAESVAADFQEAFGLCRRLGHLGGAATALGGLARIAHQRGDLTRAVELCAATDALRAQAGATLAGPEQSAAVEFVARLRDALGPEVFERAWDAGRSVGLDGAQGIADPASCPSTQDVQSMFSPRAAGRPILDA